MDSPTPPTPPDPVATANAQANLNQSTATTQQLLNQTNQVTPDGSLTYNQTGSNSFTGADGKSYTVPQFTATQSLSPAQQKIYDLLNTTKTNLGQIGVDQSAKIGDLLGTNVNLDTATESKIDQLGSARLDPQFAKSEDALRTQLANKGIQPGSAAWNSEMTNFSQGKNDAYNQLYLSGRSQGAQEALTERNQPINEISALMSGSQVSQPNFTNTPQTSVGGVDYMGAVNNNYNAANQQYQTQVGANNAMMGGLFGLAGTVGTAGIKYSDRRLKRLISRIGRLSNGMGLYRYQYVWGGPFEVGLMADEVALVKPEAVSHDAQGFAMVDYGKALEAR